MGNQKSGLVRLEGNLRKKKKTDTPKPRKRPPHAKGGPALATPIDDNEQLRQIIVNQQNNYKDILSDELQAEVLIEKNPENVKPLLQMAAAITAQKTGFVIVGDIKTTLPRFRSTFSKAPFYVLSVNAPDVSFAFSELINEMTADSAIHKKAVLESLWAGGQNKANDFNSKLQQNIEDIKASGFSKTRDIINKLNEDGFKTRRGEDWTFDNFYRAEKQIKKIQMTKGPNQPQ